MFSCCALFTAEETAAGMERAKGLDVSLIMGTWGASSFSLSCVVWSFAHTNLCSTTVTGCTDCPVAKLCRLLYCLSLHVFIALKKKVETTAKVSESGEGREV